MSQRDQDCQSESKPRDPIPPSPIPQTADDIPSPPLVDKPDAPSRRFPSLRRKFTMAKAKRLVSKVFRRPEKIWLQQGITGSVKNGPYFDGSSMNPLDHLIDLDTDSMETEPDIRVYFWIVGRESPDCANIQDTEIPLGSRAENGKAMDAKLVRAGREYLKELRDQGLGWFLSPERTDLLAHNTLDDPWYRMPTAGICSDFFSVTEPMPGEGLFFGLHSSPLHNVMPTNMRVPLWCAETLKAVVKPGTEGWDAVVTQLYQAGNHPGSNAFDLMDLAEIIDSVVWPGNTLWANHSVARQVLARDWPTIAQQLEPPLPNRTGFLGISGHTVDQFLGRTKMPEALDP